MNREAVLETFDRQLRREARPDGAGDRVERVAGVVRHLAAAGGGRTGDGGVGGGGVADGWSGIVWSGLDDATADAAIAAQVRYFTDLGREFEWKLYAHDRPADLADRLAAAGFVPEPAETLMVAQVADLPTGVDLPEPVHLRPVSTPADVDLMRDVHDQAFGTDFSALRASMLTRLAAGRLVAVLALAGDLPVSAARMELHAGTEFASLWSGGTVPAWRGKGIYRALVAYRTRIAAERGYRYLQVDASDDSRPILQRLGFHPLTTTIPYVYRP
ncbi:GNAT family N-acetyltransferase [Nonomuraea sp. NPDC049714]|uniref:GNAT family N-acetyltransferase n=1 Tax=Nonomuraea sp. NPDC049714 TaxID=3364357 RepID=UPI00378D633F